MPPQGTVTRRVEVRHSPVHGHGVFALKPLPPGSVIGLYTGRRYTPEALVARQWDNALTYVFGLSDGSAIDGADGGNATRYINHSCAPNCAAFEIEDDDGHLWVEVEALTRIAPGQELFIDYSLDTKDAGAGSYRCCCGAALCRGTMAGE
jgi:SET domain-containing protein